MAATGMEHPQLFKSVSVEEKVNSGLAEHKTHTQPSWPQYSHAKSGLKRIIEKRAQIATLFCESLPNLETLPLNFTCKIYSLELCQGESKRCLIYHVQLSFDSDSILEHYIMQTTS